MIVVHDFEKRELNRAAMVRSLSFTGSPLGSSYLEMPPDICNVQCGLNREPEPPLLKYLLRLPFRDWKDRETWSTLRGLVERQVIFRQVTLRSFDARGTNQPDDVLDNYLKQIAAYRPALLKGLPTYLLCLARHVHHRKLGPPIVGEIRPMGSAMAPSSKREIAAAFDCPVVEDYGSAELGPIGCECGPGRGIHIFSDLFFIEVVRDGRPAKPGEVGCLLITDLANRAMPLIRYDIGDVGRLLPGPCPCGRGTPVVRVEGRVQDSLVNPSGRIFTEHEITDFFSNQPSVGWFRLEQRTGWRFDLEIVAKGTEAVPLDQLIQDLTVFLGDGVNRRREVRSVIPEVGGKFRFLKSTTGHLI